MALISLDTRNVDHSSIQRYLKGFDVKNDLTWDGEGEETRAFARRRTSKAEKWDDKDFKVAFETEWNSSDFK